LKPINDTNKNIHNVLFRNAFPRLHAKYLTNVNNYTALIYRYLFYSQFSDLTTHHKFCETLRKTTPAKETFKNYIFDLNLPNVTGMSPILTQIS